jgi:8-oxo-dGTP pyrophosphatase MutT (NUDIX family)
MDMDRKWENILNRPLFKALIDVDELRLLEQEFGTFRIEAATVPMNDAEFHHWYDAVAIKRKRRGEVVLLIENNKGQILLHTKSFYPKGVYRIPTGGIHFGESVLAALEREMYEETGFNVLSKKLIALTLYQFTNSKSHVGFPSYLFRVKTTMTSPRPQDSGERITNFCWIDVSELEAVTDCLLNLNEAWNEWGKMRAVPHRLALEYCRQTTE